MRKPVLAEFKATTWDLTGSIARRTLGWRFAGLSRCVNLEEEDLEMSG